MSDIASSDYPASVLRISGTMLAVVNLRCYMSSITDSSSMRNSSVSVLIHVCCLQINMSIVQLDSSFESESAELTLSSCFAIRAMELYVFIGSRAVPTDLVIGSFI